MGYDGSFGRAAVLGILALTIYLLKRSRRAGLPSNGATNNLAPGAASSRRPRQSNLTQRQVQGDDCYEQGRRTRPYV